MPFMSFEADLKKIGLSDKEASVYLAALGLGASPVQPIARKAKVARATTYLVLEGLMKQGLVTRFVEDGKTLFVAESPEQLVRILDKREEDLKRRRGDLSTLVPKLQAFLKTGDDKPVVRYYTGLEGLKTIRSELSMNSKPNDVWCQISPVDHMRAVYKGEDFTYANQRKAKRIISKAIITTRSKDVKDELLKTTDKWAQRKFVEPKKYTSSSGMTILPDRIAIVTLTGDIGGSIVESESVATMMRELFDIAWEGIDSK